MSLGDAYSDLQQYDKANAYYAQVPDKSQLYMKARIKVAMNETQKGNLDRALVQLDKLARALPKEYEPLVVKGDLLRMHRRFSEASEIYTQAIQKLAGKHQSYHWPLFFSRGVTL